MKTIKEKYEALCKMLPGILPLKTFEEVGAFNASVRKAIEELKALINQYNKPEKTTIFNLLKPVFERYADERAFHKQLWEQVEKDPKFDGTYKLKLQAGFFFHGGLRAILQDIEYDVLKEKGMCNCKLKQKLFLSLRKKSDLNLNFLKISDNYYDLELHQCPECGTYWEYDPGKYDGSSCGWRQISEKNMKQYGLI